MGRYGSEIFRACRLVVDTGLHPLNWSRLKAENFMYENTALHRPAIEFEVIET